MRTLFPYTTLFRSGCPIFTYEHILDSAGILMEDSSSKKKKASATATVSTTDSGGSREDLKALSMDDLTSLLNEVLEQEDYIRAIAIRDEINSRRKTR